MRPLWLPAGGVPNRWGFGSRVRQAASKSGLASACAVVCCGNPPRRRTAPTATLSPLLGPPHPSTHPPFTQKLASRGGLRAGPPTCQAWQNCSTTMSVEKTTPTATANCFGGPASALGKTTPQTLGWATSSAGRPRHQEGAAREAQQEWAALLPPLRRCMSALAACEA